MSKDWEKLSNDEKLSLLTPEEKEKWPSAYYSDQVVHLEAPLKILKWNDDRSVRFSSYGAAVIKIVVRLPKDVKVKWVWVIRDDNTSQCQSPLHFESDWCEDGVISMKSVCARYPALTAPGDGSRKVDSLFDMLLDSSSDTTSWWAKTILTVDPTTHGMFLDHGRMEVTGLVFSRGLTKEEKKMVEKSIVTYYNILVRWIGHSGREYTSYRMFTG